MGSSLASQSVTISEYLKFKAPAGYRDELVYGRIIVSPEPKPLHFDIAENIYKLLDAAAGQKFKVAQRVNLRFSNESSMPSPDVFVMGRDAWIRARSLSDYPDGEASVLVVEVLSPGNRKSAIQRKVKLYCKHKIESWVVDPREQKLTVHRDGEILSLSLVADKIIALPKLLGRKSISLARIFDLSS